MARWSLRRGCNDEENRMMKATGKPARKVHVGGCDGRGMARDGRGK